MKTKLMMILLSLLVFGFISCDKDSTNPTDNNKDTTNTDNPNNPDNPDNPDNPVLQPIQWSMIGKINHDTWTPGEEAKVMFSRFPKTVKEFKDLQQKLGKEPHGAVALELMAMEMYRKNVSIGTECLQLANTSNNVNPITSRLKELFRKNDSYARYYQIAAFLSGASAENGYNPTKPYTVEIKVNPTNEYQFSNDYQAQMLFLLVKSNGHDNGQQIVYVIKPAGDPYFIVNNCPGLYSQCKKIAYGQTFNDLD